jgi:hypothetical protein
MLAIPQKRFLQTVKAKPNLRSVVNLKNRPKSAALQKKDAVANKRILSFLNL